MTETERKALAWLNEVAKEMDLSPYAALDHNLPGHRALYRAIERIEALEATRHDCLECGYAKPLMELQAEFEAFRREVSDAILSTATGLKDCDPKLWPFIIAEPDPLVEALDSLGLEKAGEWAPDIRKALAARGLEIREKQP